ncbi:MAG TPA: thioredoxin family protein [Planctomycetota bacterium]|nr:thioredoxin family protein [Planctomycetota bacterium]
MNSASALRRPALALLLALFCSAGCGPDELAPLPGWGADYEKAAAQAAAERKPMAVLFSAAWSPAAAKFESQALADQRVAGLLAGHVRVRLDLDQESARKTALALGARDRNDNVGAPWLVLVSPEGERRSVAGQCGADHLAGFLGTLGRWQPLAGWESDPAAAEARARETGKPLAVLYSAAWEQEAAAFERQTLSDAKVVAGLGAFTLLRLNIAAHAKRAEADKVKAAPALVLPAPGGSLVVPEKCTPAALLSCVSALGGKPRDLPGWSADREAARKQAGAEGKPLALLLDSADWPCAKFAGAIQDSPDATKALEPFVRVRVDFAGISEKDRADWQANKAPCLVLFDAAGKRYGTYGLKNAAEAPERIAERVADGLKMAAAKTGS